MNTETHGTRRNPSWNNLDLRLEKQFSFGKFTRLGISVDVYNAANNANIFTTTDFHEYIELDGNFIQPITEQQMNAVSLPRVAKLDLHFTL